jgi:A/G-specific adenine glycosylase
VSSFGSGHEQFEIGDYCRVGWQESDFGPSEAQTLAFTDAVWEHHRRNRRDLPWRRTHDPYEILVSEVMLQQTQVARVQLKYGRFLASFPTVRSLSAAPIADVLAAWSGLGYNRRALSLHQAAKMTVDRYGGRIPTSPEKLRRLPGIGPATAAAVCVFAFGQPHAFIETNIRSAFIHFFFQESTSVSDADILPLVEKTMDRDDPREWFYALMDYGVWVKRVCGNPNRKSKAHTVQSAFAGSRRQVRARALDALLAIAPRAATADAVRAMLPGPSRDLEELVSVLDDLAREGFLKKAPEGYRIA